MALSYKQALKKEELVCHFAHETALCITHIITFLYTLI